MYALNIKTETNVHGTSSYSTTCMWY